MELILKLDDFGVGLDAGGGLGMEAGWGETRPTGPAGDGARGELVDRGFSRAAGEWERGCAKSVVVLTDSPLLLSLTVAVPLLRLMVLLLVSLLIFVGQEESIPSRSISDILLIV